MMKFTAYDELAASEGLRLTAYRDSAGIWTIGYGHTGPDVRPGMKISQAQAEALLDKDIAWAVEAVSGYVHATLNQRQFNALVMLVYNIGASAFAQSTLLRKLNDGDYAGAAAQFLVWNKATINGHRQVIDGLTNRRAREKALFERPMLSDVPAPVPPLASGWLARLIAAISAIFRRA